MPAPPRKALLAILPALAALTLAACGSSSSGSSSQTTSTAAATTPTAAALVRTGDASTLGATVLTNAQGMTLYSLSGEASGKFICSTSACTAIWHPLLAPSTGSPSGSVGSLSTVTRPDGSEQVTYKGMPLYTFADDQKAGEAKGQGVKDVGTWSAVRVSSTAQEAATTSAPASASGSSGSAPESSSESSSESGSSGGSSGSSGGYGY